MSGEAPEAGPRRPPPAELAVIAVVVLLFGYLAWDAPLWEPALQLVLHLAALGGVLVLYAALRRGASLPRTRIDLPVLALLVVFGVASLSAWNVGLSIRSLGAVVGFAVALPLALLTLRRRPAWTAAAVSLPVLLLAAGSLAVMLPRRVQWLLAEGPGLLPPARLGADGSAFGGVAVPPFVILATLPLTLLLPPGALRRLVQVGLLAVGVPLTVLSGSRSAWLAIGVAGLVLAAPLLRHVRRPRRLTARHAALAAGLLVLSVPLLLTLLPRLGAVTSLIYRGFLWRDTLAAVATDPLLGLGPGAMPFARQAAAPAFSFPVHQPHSHNVPLGLLGDAGLVGLVAGLALFAALLWVAGPWRQRSWPGRAASAVLIGFGVSSLFEDLTFLPGFVLLVILLAALALEGAGAVDWRPRRLPGPLARGGLLAGSALVLAMLLGDAAAISYAGGVAESIEGRWGEARAAFGRAERLDPWHPMHPKALAIAAAVLGDRQAAAAAARRAVAHNPGDAESWANLALLCRDAGDAPCASHAADQAVRYGSSAGREQVNAAAVLESVGEADAADRAYRLALLTNRHTGFVTSWPRPIDIQGVDLVEVAEHDLELHRLLARLALGEPLRPDEYESEPVRALALALAGEEAAARQTLDAALRTRRDLGLTWEVAALLRRHWGEELDRTLLLAELVRGDPMPMVPAQLPGAVFDIAAFRRVPLDGLIPWAEHLLPDVAWPWLLAPHLPAR